MTSTSHIARGYRIASNELPDLVNQLVPIIKPRWWLVSWITKTTLSRRAATDGLEETTEGRAFGITGEIRWRVDETNARVVVVVDRNLAANLPDTDTRDLGLVPESSTSSSDLWGEWDPISRSWREGRFPNPLDYESKGTDERDRVQITAQTFTDTGLDGPRIAAFVDAALEPWDGESV